jgi:hypothetical protein
MRFAPLRLSGEVLFFSVFSSLMHSTRCVIATIFFLLLASASASQAQLHWNQLEQRFEVRPRDKFVQTKYQFTNVGSQAVTIDMVLTSCGCTTTALTKTVYQPGESGELVVRYDFDASSGHQEKSILVTTNDNSHPTELRLVVDFSG